MRVLGVDPGSRVTGLGVVEAAGNRMLCLHFEGVRLGGEEFSGRMVRLARRLEEVVETFRPDAAALEQAFVQRNVQSALKLGQVRGAVMVTLGMLGIPVGEYPPATVKVALTGYGRAEKAQVRTMVQHILGLDAPPRSLDASDALAVALCHLLHRGGRIA